MRHTLILMTAPLIPLLLGSCNGGPGPIDSRAFLTKLDGPRVSGISDPLVQAAQTAEAQGNFRLAAQAYEQAREKHPEDAGILLGLADSYRRDAQTQKAIAAYDALLAREPAHIAAREGKGLALIAGGDFDTPAVLFDEVMQADARRWKTLNALGILFTTRNLQPEAQAYFREALKHHPDSASILNNLALSQALERNFDGSVSTLHKASALAAPASQERRRIDLNTALVQASAGRVDAARQIAEQYLTGAELDNNLGLYAHLARDDNMAKAYLNKALSDSKMYYARAWENLEDIAKQSGVPQPGKPEAKKPEPAGQAPLKKTAAPKAALPPLPPSAAAGLSPSAGPITPDNLPAVTLADAPPAPPASTSPPSF